MKEGFLPLRIYSKYSNVGFGGCGEAQMVESYLCTSFSLGLENFKLTGSSDDGELIYVQTKLFKSFHVIYRGIVDNDFRKRHGLGDGRLRGLQVFHNHIETLLSY